VKIKVVLAAVAAVLFIAAPASGGTSPATAPALLAGAETANCPSIWPFDKCGHCNVSGTRYGTLAGMNDIR
jgi:hypothetical protein